MGRLSTALLILALLSGCHSIGMALGPDDALITGFSPAADWETLVRTNLKSSYAGQGIDVASNQKAFECQVAVYLEGYTPDEMHKLDVFARDPILKNYRPVEPIMVAANKRHGGDVLADSTRRCAG